MAKSAPKRAPVPEHAVDGWEAKALELGWPGHDVAGLRTVLATAQGTEVHRVGKTVILLRTAVVLDFGHRQIPHEGYWQWRRSLDAVSVEAAPAPPQAPWCPAHATACGPDEHGCGELRMRRLSPDLIIRQFCACQRTSHHRGCELYGRALEHTPLAERPRNGKARSAGGKARGGEKRRGVLEGQKTLIR